MLHILTEGNKELANRRFPLGKGIRKHLQQTLDGYTGDKTTDGWKRLNNLLGMKSVSYQEMKRIKNFFDNYQGTPKSAEYILNGGREMQTWVDNTLNTATKAVHDFKQAKKDAGIKNAFIRPHDKQRQIRKDKPTTSKVQTGDVASSIANNATVKYEGLIREWSDRVEDMYYEYGVDNVLRDFAGHEEGKTQSWGTLINAQSYQTALGEFMKYGKFERFPTKYVYQWMGTIIRNTIQLDANTALAGHKTYFPWDEIDDFLESYEEREYDLDINKDEVKLLCSEDEAYDIIMKFFNGGGLSWDRQLAGDTEDMGNLVKEFNEKNYHEKFEVDGDGQYWHVTSLMTYLDNIGLYDWMKMPDGTDAWSDYGLDPLWKIIDQYKDDMTPEQVIVLVNKALDVGHQRGDIPSIFITGGSKSLTAITYGGVAEKKKRRTICISEAQAKAIQSRS